VSFGVGLVSFDIGPAQPAGKLRGWVRLTRGNLSRAAMLPRVLAQLVSGEPGALGIGSTVGDAAATALKERVPVRKEHGPRLVNVGIIAALEVPRSRHLAEHLNPAQKSGLDHLPHVALGRGQARARLAAKLVKGETHASGATSKGANRQRKKGTPAGATHAPALRAGAR